MSLINQMLKDLEQRRANDLQVNNGTLQSVNRYIANNANGQSSLLLGAVISLIVLVSILLGYLLWEKFSEGISSEPVSLTSLSTVQQPKLSSAKVLSKAPLKKQITSAKAKANQPKAKIRAAKKHTTAQGIATATLARQTPTKLNASEPVAMEQREAIGSDPNGSDRVVKQNRALTKKQQAGVLYQKAYKNLQTGQINLAEEQLRNSININPGYSRSRELLAGSYIRSGRYVEAGKLLKQGLIVEPKNYHFAKLYARVLMQQNKQQAALDMLVRHRPALQQDLEYFALIAALYQQTRQHLKAANMYKDLLQLKPDRGIWWIGLGVALEKNGNAPQAHQAYSKAKESGSLNASMLLYTDNKLAAIKDSGYPPAESETEYE